MTLSATNSTSTTEHAVQLTGLSADMQYFYSVGTSSVALAGGDRDHFVVTAPSPARPSRRESGSSEIPAPPTGMPEPSGMPFSISRSRATRTSGSCWATTPITTEPIMSTRGRFSIPTRTCCPRRCSGRPSETMTATTADSTTESGPYYDIFSLPRNGEAGGVASGTEAYYSFDYGNMHFICLDSYETDRSADGAMMTWLEADLAANDKEWIIAFWHHAPYSKGSADSDKQLGSIALRQNAVPLLERYGVDLVLTGHSSRLRAFLSHRWPLRTFGHLHRRPEEKLRRRQRNRRRGPIGSPQRLARLTPAPCT